MPRCNLCDNVKFLRDNVKNECSIKVLRLFDELCWLITDRPQKINKHLGHHRKWIELEPYEFIGSRTELSKAVRITQSEVYTGLKRLIQLGIIEVSRSPTYKGTVYKFRIYEPE